MTGTTIASMTTVEIVRSSRIVSVTSPTGLSIGMFAREQAASAGSSSARPMALAVFLDRRFTTFRVMKHPPNQHRQVVMLVAATNHVQALPTSRRRGIGNICYRNAGAKTKTPQSSGLCCISCSTCDVLAAGFACMRHCCRTRPNGQIERPGRAHGSAHRKSDERLAFDDRRNPSVADGLHEGLAVALRLIGIFHGEVAQRIVADLRMDARDRRRSEAGGSPRSPSRFLSPCADPQLRRLR